THVTSSSVDWALVPGTAVAHVRISQVGATTADELGQALQAAQSAGAEAIVLDLRANPGGLGDQAVAMLGRFVDGGPVLLEQDRSGPTKSFSAPSGLSIASPVVAITDRKTA